MRRLILGLALLLVLGMTASAVLAQSDQTGSSQSGSSNYQSQSDQSNPAGQSQTISGTVVSSDNKSLVITTDSGQQMKFSVDQNTLPQNLQPGQRVDVNFIPQSGGKFKATQVSLSSSTAPGATEQGTSTSGTSGTSNQGTSSSTYGTAPSGTSQGTMGTMGQNQPASTSRRHLPGTASPLPLIGLSGLIALAGAFGLRLAAQRSE